MRIVRAADAKVIEEGLAAGTFPVARLQTSAHFRKYLKERVKIEFDGLDQSDGLIAEAKDEATGIIDEIMTQGNILTIHGSGLKIEADEDHQNAAGLWFDRAGINPEKADIIAVNEPRTLKVLVPNSLDTDGPYTLRIVTQSSAKGSSSLLKDLREMRSEFTLAVHN